MRYKFWVLKTLFTIFLTDLFVVIAELYRVKFFLEPTQQNEVLQIVLYFCIIILSVALAFIYKVSGILSAKLEELEKKGR